MTVAVDSLAKLRAGALLVGGDALFNVSASQIIQRATSLRVPVAHYWPGTAEMGAVLTHGADFPRNFERSAYYVDRILKGTKPGRPPRRAADALRASAESQGRDRARHHISEGDDSAR